MDFTSTNYNYRYIVKSTHFPNDIEKAITEAFYKTDAEFSAKAKISLLRDGSTALVCVINNKHIYIGNSGDCRAILIKKMKLPLPLTGMYL